MLQFPPAIPTRFLPAYQCIAQLEQYDRYLAAYIFGSFARGETTEHSDLDVNVIVDEDNPCTNINHPVIDGVKLDITFLSLAQLKARTDKEMERRERIPMIAESWIVFDKTNQLMRSWDSPLAQLVENFVATSDVQTKFSYWLAIIDHILAPIGGRQPIAENNCDCEVCRQDLAMIYSDQKPTYGG